MNTVNDQELRKTYIGGSDIAAIMGLSPYRTRYQVWAEKTGRTEPKAENESMMWGKRIEDLIARHYAQTMSERVRRRRALVRHTEYDFLGGHLDRRVVGKPIGLECKLTTDNRGWGEAWSDDIPEYPLCQVHHYLEVFDLEEMHVAVLLAHFGFRFHVYRVRRGELGRIIVDQARDFWANHVVKDVPPDPSTETDIRHRFAKAIPSAIEATAEVVSREIERRDFLTRAKEYDEQAKKWKLEIMKYMGPHEVLISNDKRLVTWKPNKNGSRVFRGVKYEP